jgi:hypothetical protein
MGCFSFIEIRIKVGGEQQTAHTSKEAIRCLLRHVEKGQIAGPVSGHALAPAPAHCIALILSCAADSAGLRTVDLQSEGGESIV